MIGAADLTQHFQQMSLHAPSILEARAFNLRVLSANWDERHSSLALDAEGRLKFIPFNPCLDFQHYTPVLNVIVALFKEYGESIQEQLTRLRAEMQEDSLSDLLHKATALQGLQEIFKGLFDPVQAKVKAIERAVSPFYAYRVSADPRRIGGEVFLTYAKAVALNELYKKRFSHDFLLYATRDLLAPKSGHDRSIASIGLMNPRFSHEELYIGRWFDHPVCRGELFVALRIRNTTIDPCFQFKYITEQGVPFLFKGTPFWSEQVDTAYEKMRSKEWMSQVDFGFEYVNRCFNNEAVYHPSSCLFSFRAHNPTGENTQATVDLYHFMIEWGVQTGMDALYLSSVLPYAPLQEALGFKRVETSSHSFSHQERAAVSSAASVMIDKGILRHAPELMTAYDPYSHQRLFRFDVATLSDPLPFFKGQSWSDKLNRPILQQPVAQEWPSLSGIPIGQPLLTLRQLQQRELGLRARAQIVFEAEEMPRLDAMDALAEQGALVRVQKSGEQTSYFARFKRL